MSLKHLSFRNGFSGLLLLALVALGAGCSGIHATKSISPLDFILPGLGMTDSAEEGLTPTGSSEAPAHDAGVRVVSTS
jgi:hypothetical protein